MRNMYKGFVALFNLRLLLFLGSTAMRHKALCYLQCRCERSHRFSRSKLVSEFYLQKDIRDKSRSSTRSVNPVKGLGRRSMSICLKMPQRNGIFSIHSQCWVKTPGIHSQ